MKIKAEFHCHSTASDGAMKPSQVIEIAKDLNLTSIALTDHDTTKGLEEATQKAAELKMKFIPGIELSCDYKDKMVHILGYFKDNSYKEKELQDFLLTLETKRISRAKKIVEKLDKIFDIKINYKDVLNKGKGVIARPHIAQTILDAGYDYSWDEIFEKFIGNDSPAYVPNEKLDVRDGIKLLKKFNAIVVLAHPKLIKNNLDKEILSFDFDGIEAIYFQHTKEETFEYISIAESKNMLITCGSDCHGNSKEDTKHGFIGDMQINETYYNKFMNIYNQ
ncbi:MAG: PHP domain-containing protein [Sarcina sp.]